MSKGLGEVADKDGDADQTDEGRKVATSTASDEEQQAQQNDHVGEQRPAKEPGKWLQGEDPVNEDILATQQNRQDEKDALYVRFPYMACEVICCEIKSIIDILVDGFVPVSMEDQLASIGDKEQIPTNGNNERDPRGRPILDLLFSILYVSKPGEIDDYRAGYFDKILSVLFRKRPQAMSLYINEGGGRGGTDLMEAMFKHLYSHSMMQIVQRLLLPQPPLPLRNDDDEDNQDGEDLFGGTMDGVDFDGMGSFRCNWSESEASLDMLLDCLIGNGPAPEIEQDEERKLSLYQNASEVLITIIQNSPLTSPTLHLLTTDPVLERLILAATHIDEGSSFSHHDSRLTCAMNVLESLILQLGGYGSVGTMMFNDEDEGDGDQDVLEQPLAGSTSNEPGGEPSSLREDTPCETSPLNFATSDTLIQHLSTMLSSLGNLLLYPGAENWLSPMQFSRTEPQKLLGSSRLRIVRLLESLVLLGDPNVDALLCESDCLEICLDLFWKFQWCSMLHQSVANLLVHVFEGQNARSELQSYFLVKCNLLGRLMDSFWEGTEECIESAVNVSNAKISEDLMALKNGEERPDPSSVASEKGSSDDILPVSDDDVDAAMEQQEAAESDSPLDTDASKEIGSGEKVAHDVPEHAPPQSFRLGYMGHVIIICQALVHACTNDGKSESPSLVGGAISEEMNGDLERFVGRFSGTEQDLSPQKDGVINEAFERSRAGESVATEETPSSAPLILAQLVDTHPLSRNWQEFVSTTLASETAIQSTPLGGFQGSSPGMGMDPLHAHRPGLAEDDDYDDDGAAPPLPPRGLLVGGDVIDMDDNDLDVAASMMAGLSMRRGPNAGPDGRTDQDLLASIPPQPSGPPQGGYMFDDPLGDGRFGKFDDDGDDSSSDEESELSGNTGDSSGAVDGASNDATGDNDAPVMDLFAGNFDAFGEKDVGDQDNGNWSDFANFDDAFAGAHVENNNPAGETKSNLDDVFAEVKDHAMLLEELDHPPIEKHSLSPEKLDFSEGEVLSANPAKDEGTSEEL
jgi:hypothetical protein